MLRSRVVKGSAPSSRSVGLRLPFLLLLTASCVVLAGCGPAAEAPSAPPVTPDELARDPADAFLARIAEHCGEAYAGRIVADEPPPPGEDPFAGKDLVLHVRSCTEGRIEIPFHVGEDRSRTWVLTRTADGLRLKHDHRHEDGSHDEVTMYGGDTAEPGTEVRQEFPVDAESIATFEENGLAASVVNVWAMEIEPGERFVYELARPGTERLFRVEFDLTTPVPEPPAPWGHGESADSEETPEEPSPV